jgi:hypothetical protein
MLKWLRRSVIALFVIIALPCIAFTGLLVQSFPPTFALGRGISDLSHEDQVAYLILTDQMRYSAELDKWRRRGGILSIGVGIGDTCSNPGAALDRALARSWVFSNITRAPADCSQRRDLLYVSKEHDVYMGGYSCGGLCGAGNQYRAARPFGIAMVIRTGGYIH